MDVDDVYSDFDVARLWWKSERGVCGGRAYGKLLDLLDLVDTNDPC